MPSSYAVYARRLAKRIQNKGGPDEILDRLNDAVILKEADLALGKLSPQVHIQLVESCIIAEEWIKNHGE